MTRKKKLIILFSCLGGALITLVILMFTLFGLGSVTMDFKNQTTLFTQDAQADICNNQEYFKKHSCVFFINKKEIANKLEKNYPELEVINIETVFPNKMVVHCKQREEVYLFNSGSKIYYTDSALKVLKIDTCTDGVLLSNRLNGLEVKDPIFIQNAIVNNNVVVGEFLQLEEEKLIKSISYALSKNSRTIAEQKALFKKIEITYEEHNYYTLNKEPVLVVTDFNNFQTKIYLPQYDLDKKFQIMLATVPALNPSLYSSYYLKIDHNISSNKLTAIAELKTA